MKKENGTRSFVETLRDQTEQYAQNLLRENEKLRALALAVETENTRLQDEVASARAALAEARALREGLDALLHEKAQLQMRLEEMAGELAGLRADRATIVEQLAAAEHESRGIAEQYATAMRQNASLANLYVSSYMLHSSLDRMEVLSGIAQIIVNIVGSEDYAIFERVDGDVRPATSGGNGVARLHSTEAGAGLLDNLAREARVRVFDGAAAQHGLSAFIPLAIGDYVTGGVAIGRLLPQKRALTESDSEIFEMLSAHAAAALYCASLHARHGRELSPCDRAHS